MHDISFFPYSAKLQTPSKGLDTYSQAAVVIHQFLLLPRFPGVVAFLLIRRHKKLTDCIWNNKLAD